VDRVTQWFEQEDQYDRAVEIYEEMLKSSEANIYPEVAELARETAEYGLTRSKLQKQKIDLVGVTPDGSPLDPKTFDGRVVAVVFWSPKDHASIDALTQVYEETESWRNSGGRVLAVCLDRPLGVEAKLIIASMSDVVFAVADPKGNDKNAIWEQCPSKLLPRAMLVDRSGVVVDINVPIQDVKTEAGFLTFK
jgi:hypothetical protein